MDQHLSATPFPLCPLLLSNPLRLGHLPFKNYHATTLGDVACLVGQMETETQQLPFQYHYPISRSITLRASPKPDVTRGSSVTKVCTKGKRTQCFLLPSADPGWQASGSCPEDTVTVPHLTLCPFLMKVAGSHTTQRWRPLMTGWSLRKAEDCLETEWPVPLAKK